jgi:hypothetical protein
MGPGIVAVSLPATNSVWKLEGTTARFDDGRLQARVDLLAPLRGLHALSFAGKPLAADDAALGVDVPLVAADDLSLPETYARVDDLVATYLQTESRPFRLQAYWRRVEFDTRSARLAGTAIELQVSINTSLLDTHPSVAVSTHIAGAREAAASHRRRYTITRAALGLVYFEALHPTDEFHAAPAAGMSPGNSAATHTLFGDFLEKGVIVRARIRGVFLPAEIGAPDLDALYDDFVNEPLPLTT